MPVWGELLELLGTATLDEEGNAELELGATDELLGTELDEDALEELELWVEKGQKSLNSPPDGQVA